MKTYIYALIDPRNPNVVYIGKSNNPKQRYVHHCFSDQYKSIKRNWIINLKKEGLLPQLEIICKVNINHWQEAERDIIRRFKLSGKNLKNGSYGGDGMGFCTPEISKKLSLSRLGPKNPNYGKPMSIEIRQKISNRKKGIKQTQKHRESIGKGLLNSNLAKSMYTKERSRKIRETKFKNKSKWIPILQIDKLGNIIKQHDSITQASLKTGISLGNIGSVLRNERKTAGKFNWKYAC